MLAVGRITQVLIPVLTLFLALAVAGPAAAGCGCDHPPPDWAEVVPAFGSPNKVITIYAVDGEFEVGKSYTVNFGKAKAHSVTTTSKSQLKVRVPRRVAPGPVAIRVRGSGYSHSYPDVAFTALWNPRKIGNREGVFNARNFTASVTADGTLLLPLNLTDVQDEMQFAFALRDLRLAFDADQVAIYNSDGVDLSLFSPRVASNGHEWGDYYGWTVESDAGIETDFYEGLSVHSDKVSRASDLFTYWRHEFRTYQNAHAKGGSHEVDSNGYHPDLTYHIDHDNLVIAIQGVVRDKKKPHDRNRARHLRPGLLHVELGWVSLRSEDPVDLRFVVPLIGNTDKHWAEELEEVLFEEAY